MFKKLFVAGELTSFQRLRTHLYITVQNCSMHVDSCPSNNYRHVCVLKLYAQASMLVLLYNLVGVGQVGQNGVPF